MAPGIPIELTFIYHLLVAIGLGGLIGVERELHVERQGVLVGIRTFPLVAVVGFVFAYLTNLSLDNITTFSPIMLGGIGLGLAVVSAFAIALLFVRMKLGQPGFTTPLAFVVTYLIGVLVGYSLLIEAVVVGVATTFLLASKEHLHEFATLLTGKEIIEALQFITIAFIIFPLIASISFTPPFDIFGAGGALDIATILLIVILVSALSFISFLVMRWQGPRRGLRYSGLFGGLVNSEAATASLCERAKKESGIFDAAASAVILANATMFIRNLFVSMISDPSLSIAKLIVAPLVVLSVLGIILGFTMKVRETTTERLEVKSPFSLGFALRFAAVFLVISAVTIILSGYVSEQSVYLIAIGAFVSSAAVTASIASLAAVGQVSPSIAATTILIACAISSFNKIIISRAVSKPVLDRTWIYLTILGVATIVASVALTFLSGV